MRNRIFLLATLLSLLIPLVPSGSAQIIEMDLSARIGYSPENLFDSDVGIPVFVRGESLWVFPQFPAFVSLLGPDDSDIVRLPIGTNPFRVHTFSDEDPLGIYTLSFEGRAGSFSVFLELGEQFIEPISHQERLSLSEQSLLIDGTVSLDLDGIPTSVEVILTSQMQDDPVDIFSNVIIEGNPINIRLESIEVENGLRRIWVSLHAPTLTAGLDLGIEYEGEALGPLNVWAEMSSEIALSKRTGESLFLTFIDEGIADTPRVSATVSGEPSQVLAIDIPTIGQLNKPWLIPPKYGRSLLSVFLEFEGIIHVARIPVVIFPNEIIINPDSRVRLSSFDFPLRYSFDQPLESPKSYQIILAAKVDGLESLWRTRVTPLLATIIVENEFTGRSILNYDINLTSTNLQTAKVGDTTFVLLPQAEIITEFDLAIDSIIVRSARPTTLSLRSLSRTTIFATEGTVLIDVVDTFGLPAPPGEIIIRGVGPLSSDPIRLDWREATVSVRLPGGRYQVEASVNGISSQTQFAIDSETTSVQLSLESLFDQNTSIIIAVSGSVLILEAVVAILVWRKALAKQ